MIEHINTYFLLIFIINIKMSQSDFDYGNKPLPIWKNQQRPKKGEQYIDPYFPPNINSLISKKPNGEFVDKIDGPSRADRIPVDNLEWKRVSEIFKGQRYLLFENKIEMADINQGTLGDCYFLASAAALTEFPNLVYKMFKTKGINKEGYFEIIFFIDGQFQVVIVDDYLPVNKQTGQIAFARPNKNELWVCVLEKAWAKINGGYSNIIKGWMRHVLTTFTGFAHTTYTHTSTDPEVLWKAISNADGEQCIMSSSSRKEVENLGLVNSHAYTLEGTVTIQSRGEDVRLVKMRNTWGYKEWKGEWSDGSSRWGPEEKQQLPEHVDKDDGTFYISFEDYYNFFIVTDICFIMYDSHSKSFIIDKEDEIKNGQVFNIYMEEEGMFSVSLIRKMWRFNRELKDVNIPASIVIMKYNPDEENSNKILNSMEGAFDCYEDISITKFLEKGIYIIYVYHDYFHSSANVEDYYVVKFDSPSLFRYKQMQSDDYNSSFRFLKLMMLYALLSTKEQFEAGTNTLSYVNEYKNTGIGHKILYNSSDKYLRYVEDTSTLDNMFMLSPYDIKNNKIETIIPPGGFGVELGMIANSNTKKKAFKLKTSITKIAGVPKDYNNDEDNVTSLNVYPFFNTTVASEEINNIETYYDYTSMSLKKAREILQFQELDMSEMTVDALKEDEDPILMKKILELPELENDNELSWGVKLYTNGRYIGQLNKNNKREGRGAMTSGANCFVGYFFDDYKSGYGVEYDDCNNYNPLYEGNWKGGRKQGKGRAFYKNGDYYEGDFEADKKKGKGKYFFKSGAVWEGDFEDDKMNGEGDYTTAKGAKTKIKYCMGKLEK